MGNYLIRINPKATGEGLLKDILGVWLQGNFHEIQG